MIDAILAFSIRQRWLVLAAVAGLGALGAGKAVVVISSDLPEAMHLAHRLIVFRNGRISAEFEGDAIQEQAVLGAFFDQERKSA